MVLKFYIDSIVQHPLTGEPDRKIIEVIADCPELERVLYEERRCCNCGEDRRIIDVARIGEGGRR